MKQNFYYWIFLQIVFSRYLPKAIYHLFGCPTMAMVLIRTRLLMPIILDPDAVRVGDDFI